MLKLARATSFGFALITSSTLVSSAVVFSLASIASAQAQQIPADQPVLQSQINRPNGVAGLDGQGRVTAPVETPSVQVQGALKASGLQQSGGNSLQAGLAQSGMPYMVQGMPIEWDGAMLPSSVVIGGLGWGDAAPLKVTSPLIGPGDWGGCVLNVQDAPFEQFARCGTGDDEAITGMFKTTNAEPLFSAGIDIPRKDDAKLAYAVSFAGDSVTFRPALTAQDQKLFYPRARLYANWRNGMLSTAPEKPNSPNLWYGYVGTLTDGQDAQGGYTTVSVLSDPVTWRSGWTNDKRTFSTTAPGQNPGDERDIYVNHYAHDAVFVGQSGKKFVFNTMIQLDPTVKNSPTRAAAGEELDLQLPDPDGWGKHNGFFTIQGKTIVLTGQDEAASDSYLEYLAGSNLISTGLKIDGIKYDGTVIQTGEGFEYYSRGDLAFHPAGDSVLLSQLGAMNAGGEIRALQLYGVKENDAGFGWGMGTLRLGVEQSRNAEKLGGMAPGCENCSSGGQIIWGPPGHQYGMALGTGFGKQAAYALYVDGDALTIPVRATLSQGAQLSMDAPSNGISGGRVDFVTGSPDTNNADIALSVDPKDSSLSVTNHHGYSLLKTERLSASGEMILPTAVYASLGGASTPGVVKYCSDCVSSLRPAGQTAVGMTVTWNGQTWVDGLGLPVVH